MARKGKGKDAESEKTPEFQKFEANLKEILKVPKSELEKREAEYKKTRGK
ncbi:MAG TPA: hypothetical protein VG944_06230 [Fimbriimonas sp.]|nr:hypothetical protein [Fimbriimonas sp.]